MKKRGFALVVGLIAAVPLVVYVSVPAAAQLLSERPKDETAAPRGRMVKKKKPPMTALPSQLIEPKKTADGWPDLQGIWSSGTYSGGAQHSLEVGRDPGAILVLGQNPDDVGNSLIDPMRGMIPYQPWSQAKRMESLAGMYAPIKRMDVGPNVLCFPEGVVASMIPEAPWELRYLPGRIVIPDNGRFPTRVIYMDGTPLSEDVKLFMGDERGHWEGNTLVVESTNNRDGTWMDAHGTFHSEAMRVVERWTMVNQDLLYYEATIIDPSVFTQSWKWAMNYDRVKRDFSNTTEEDTCHEGELAGPNGSIGDRMVRHGRAARAAGIKGYYIHVDLKTGKAVRPEEQKYLDESGQPLGYVFAPSLSDVDLATKKAVPNK